MTTNAAAELGDGTTRQELGTVERLGEHLAVRTDGGRYRARRAVSCVVEPVVDDLVLVATAVDGRCWILAVLEREEPGAVLSVDGDLRLEGRGGRVTVTSPHGVAIESGDELSLQGARFAVNALEATMVVQGFRFLGRRVRAEVEKVKTVADTVDAVAERVSQRVKRSYRWVEELEQLRAASIDHVADKTMHLKSRNTVLQAEQLVKVDGDQIHLG